MSEQLAEIAGLSVSSFSGGTGRGRMIQLTTSSDVVQLNAGEVMQLAGALAAWLGLTLASLPRFSYADNPFCPDCGARGEKAGHQDCQFPGHTDAGGAS